MNERGKTRKNLLNNIVVIPRALLLVTRREFTYKVKSIEEKNG